MKEIALPVLGRQYNAQVLIAFEVEYINVYLLFLSLVYFFCLCNVALVRLCFEGGRALASEAFQTIYLMETLQSV